jgi:ABC-2 type transport system ATP-binding protein
MTAVSASDSGAKFSPGGGAGPDADRAAAELMHDSARVELSKASRWYGNVVAVNDVSCAIGAGITALLGPNGAGKSTLLHMMAGLLKPSAGTVTINGAPAFDNPGIYRVVGLVPEREALHAVLTGRELVRMHARLQGVARPESAARQAIDAVGLVDAQDRKVSTYSKGMRQRIKVAAALVHQPRVLLLDEPFNGMDPGQRLQMTALLRALAAEGRAVLISSHILEELGDLAGNVLVMVEGRLAASGDFREIRKLMTDRPHSFTVRSSDNRGLGAALLAEQNVYSVELADGELRVRTMDRGAFTRTLPSVAKASAIRLNELLPTDESLESVFSYLVTR